MTRNSDVQLALYGPLPINFLSSISRLNPFKFDLIFNGYDDLIVIDSIALDGKHSLSTPLWHDWDIVFSYTSYFSRQIDHDAFMQLVGDVVQSGLAVISHYSEGFLVWKSSAVKVEQFDIDWEPYATPKSIDIKLPEDLNSYQAQCAFQAIHQRFCESNILNTKSQESMVYFRAYLDPCILYFESYSVKCYPSITVHKNGVFQTHFRIISNGKSITTGRLIDDFINIPTKVATNILVPPALMKLDGRKYLWDLAETLRERLRVPKKIKILNELISKSIVDVEGGEGSFDHKLVSVNPENLEDGVKISMMLINDMISSSLELLLNPKKNGWYSKLTPKKKLKYERGNFWSGRPTVYLLSMRDQPEFVSEMMESYRTAFGSLLMRSSHVRADVAEKAVKESHRLMNDYLSYTGASLNLFVFGTHATSKSDDPNANDLLFPLQSQVEYSEFIAGSFWQCEERALLHAHTVEELIINRVNQTELERMSRRAFNYGELNDWLVEVHRELDIDSTRAAIAQNTTLNLERFKEYRNFKRQQFQWLMTSIAGLIAAAITGGKLGEVLWEGFGGPPQPELRYILWAFGIVLLLFIVLYKIFIVPLRTR